MLPMEIEHVAGIEYRADDRPGQEPTTWAVELTQQRQDQFDGQDAANKHRHCIYQYLKHSAKIVIKQENKAVYEKKLQFSQVNL